MDGTTRGSRPLRHWVRMGCACAVLLSPALLSACAVPAAPRTPVTIPAASSVVATPAESAPSRVAEDAELLGTAIQGWLLSPPEFSAEPTGDLHPDGFTRVYARLSAVSTSPPTVTFDVVQFYPPELAAREARKDHEPVPEEGGWERNAHRHYQTLPVAPSAAVVGQFGAANDVAYGSAGAAQFSALSFAEFAVRFRSPGSPGLRSGGYWLMADSDGVRSIVKQYEP